MAKQFTLMDFNDPTFFISSTASLAVSTPGGGSNSFSFPPILYYAEKAKTLAKLGVLEESAPSEARFLNVADNTAKIVREVAKDVYSDIEFSGKEMNRHISCAIQSRLLNAILGEVEDGEKSLYCEPAISINASRSKKNITIPYYLLSKVTTLLNSEKAARLLIHETVHQIRQSLINSEHLDVSTGKDVLIGDAKQSSWSRKVHNILILKLIKMSNIKELSSSPSLFDVKMDHDIKIETKFASTKAALR